MSSTDPEWLAEALHATTLDIVDAARHEAIGQIDACHLHLLLALRAMERDPGRAREEIIAAGEELRDLRQVVDRMGLRRVLPRTKVEKLNVAAIVEQAAALVLGRLERSGLSVDSRQANVEIETVPYALQMTIVLLLFVSIYYDPYAGRQQRTVEVAWKPPTEPDTSRLVYADVLLDGERLARALDAVDDVKLSAREGGDMNLAIASRLLESIGGRLTVLPSSRGASFELTFPAGSGLGRCGT